MSLPPDSVSSSDLFQKLSAVERPHKIVDFPRNDENGNPICEVAIVLLSHQETVAVSAAAERTARRVMKNDIPGKNETSKGYDSVFDNASTIELLFRACKHPEDLKRSFFPSKEAISDVLIADEIAILVNHYFTTQVEFGPVIGYMSTEEMEAWIKKLQEGGSSSQYFLNSLSWEALKGLLIAMALRLSSLETVNSSAGSPLEEVIQNEPLQ